MYRLFTLLSFVTQNFFIFLVYTIIKYIYHARILSIFIILKGDVYIKLPLISTIIILLSILLLNILKSNILLLLSMTILFVPFSITEWNILCLLIIMQKEINQEVIGLK